MDETGETVAGRVVAIWRYPFKSMMGEELNAADVTETGVVGDRAYGMIDVETGKVASAKNPRRWPSLFDFRASFPEPPHDPANMPPARVTFPDGQVAMTDDPGLEGRLAAVVGRAVKVARSAPAGTHGEGYSPDYDWLEQPDHVFEYEIPAGTLFDGAPIHLVTTSSLDHLQALAPASRFDVARFRPNFVIETDEKGFAEDRWIGKTATLGEVVLAIWRPTPRCVMTTLPQGSLPKDPTVLRTSVQNNAGNVGVYATVVRGGRVRRGDRLTIA